jgi:cysteine desulfurase/selenocysteine lyase
MSLRPEQVIQKIEEYYREYPGCHGRSAHSIARRATDEMEEAREDVADLIDASPENLMWTSGTTEGINTVANGTEFEKVVATDREHNSNLVPWQESDCKLEIISTDGGIDLEELGEVVDENTLVSMVHVSNLDGWTLPAEKISEVVHDRGGMLMLDGAQSVPHRKISVKDIRPDFLAFSGHKMLGPSGTGALYVSDRGKKVLKRTESGGGAVNHSTYDSADFRDFPEGFEPGLPNLAGFIGLGEAARYMKDTGLEEIERHERTLSDRLHDVLDSINGVSRVGVRGRGVASFRVDGVDPSQVAVMLDDRDIAVRSGMHCVHSWFDSYGEEASVRASLHLYNTEEDVERLREALERIALLS